MKTTINEDQFDALLSSIERTAFRFETQDVYALDYEREDFDRFLAGAPVPPPEVTWWRPCLEQTSRKPRQDKRTSRVRLLADPPSDYQRWELWAAPWHAAAGEQIGYLTRRRAAELALPLAGDWWLLDDTRLILMSFT